MDKFFDSIEILICKDEIFLSFRIFVNFIIVYSVIIKARNTKYKISVFESRARVALLLLDPTVRHSKWGFERLEWVYING